jgi:hypothetical protein
VFLATAIRREEEKKGRKMMRNTLKGDIVPWVQVP